MRKNLGLFLGIAAAFAAFVIAYAYSNIASAAEQEPVNPDDSFFIVGSPKTADELLAEGARGYGEIAVKGPDGKIQASPTFQSVRGGSVDIPVDISYRAGASPYDSLTILPVGVTNGFIPAYVANTTTPEERVNAIQETGTISGSIDLNALLIYSPEKVILGPGESTEMTITVTLPADWPDEVVGEKLWFSVAFAPDDSEIKSTEFQMNQIAFEVEVVP